MSSFLLNLTLLIQESFLDSLEKCMNVFYLGFLPGAKGKNTTSKIFISEDYLGILKSSVGYALSLSLP